MDSNLSRTLQDKIYDRRKQAALEVEKLVKESIAAKDSAKTSLIIAQLNDLARSQHANARSGGIMGLAGCSIALGFANIPAHLPYIVPPILACFTDPDSKVRYFACESMYNVAKVAKGEILVYFNELFDAMSKLAADTELPVKNGAELLDRLIKDVVTEQASHYVAVGFSQVEPDRTASTSSAPPRTAFSLERFIPLLKERINVINPFTRMYLVLWLTVLDSVPELELVSYLPDFLEGLIVFLGDPTSEIRTATQNVLADFLREIKEIAEVQKETEDHWQKERAEREHEEKTNQSAGDTQESSKATTLDGFNSEIDGPNTSSVDSFVLPEADEQSQSSFRLSERDAEDDEGDGLGSWQPGQGVVVKHADIVEILLKQMLMTGPEADREIQATCLRWIAEFLNFAQGVILSFTPRLIPLVMSALAHHVPSLRQAAHTLNVNLFHVIAELPSPPQAGTSTPKSKRRNSLESNDSAGLPQTAAKERHSPIPPHSAQIANIPFPSASSPLPPAPYSKIPTSTASRPASPPPPLEPEPDPFDYQATVGALCALLGVEEEESRLAALHWLSMLHQKAPNKILSLDDGTFPALLKTLSDPSEEVIKSDLQLLAQISSSSDEEYFTSFMVNLVRLFSTDRSLLELRGKTIVGQLCVSLNTERIYRTFAEILEKDEDLEFASLMVQNLNLFLITLPELADFRKRLKNIDTKDGQALFSALYRSWSHNATATLLLCFLAQAYEHASNLLQIFAELEMTVSLLVQIDKLVQLLESTVFTSLRLQLLEPEKNPYLLKALYGILMLLPQSTAFVTLRNRLNSVSSLGFLHTVPRATSANYSTATSGRPVTRRQDEIKWQELLTHFRQIQFKHERARRSALHHTGNPHLYTLDNMEPSSLPMASAISAGHSNASRITSRRKVNGQGTLSRNSAGGENATKRGTSKAGSTSAHSRPLSPPVSSTGGISRRIASSAQQPITRR